MLIGLICVVLSLVVINQKNIEKLKPFTLSVILVEIKKDIAMERKVNNVLINISNNVSLIPSV